jgi:hypothetical protein
MPVRKIPKNYLHVTGSFSSKKNGRMMGYESPLERDNMILLEYDEDVESFEEQPVEIPFKKGVKPYVPDILVRFKSPRKPLLGEVKHSTDLAKNRSKYAPKFEAAKKYAEEQDWEFRTVTEKQIRIPRLASLKFLREYLNIDPDPDQVALVIGALKGARGKMEMDALLKNLCSTDMERLTMTPAGWHMVATGQVVIDMNKPIDDKTLLSLPKGRGK